MDLPNLTSGDRRKLALFAVMICLPASLIQHVSAQEAALMETASSSANHSAVRIPVMWGVGLLQRALFFVEPVFVTRFLVLACCVGIVVATAGLASDWYGRRVGLVAGAVAATMFGMTAPLWHASFSILVALIPIWCVRLFARVETDSGFRIVARTMRLVGNRPAFFSFVLSLLIATLLLEHQVVLLGVLAPLLIGNSHRLRPLTWCLFFVLVAAGPIAIRLLAGATLDQLLDRGWADVASLSGSFEWSWTQITLVTSACSPLIALGVWLTRHEATGATNSRERLLWAWAIIPPLTGILHVSLVESFIVSSGAWSLLAGVGLAESWQRVKGLAPRIRVQENRVAKLGFSLAGLICLWLGVQHNHQQQPEPDAAFFAHISSLTDSDCQLLVDSSIGSSRRAMAKRLLRASDSAETELRNAEADVLLVVATESAETRLSRLGRIRVVAQGSPNQENGKLTLFEIELPRELAGDLRQHY